MQTLLLYNNQLMGTPPFAHFTSFGSTSLPLALKTSLFALAGSIPTELGELINLTDLYLNNNNLSGTAPFAHVAWFGKRGTKRPSTGHLLTTTFHWPFAEIPGHLLKTTFRQRAALAIKRVSSLMLYLVVRVYHSPFPAKTCAVRWRWWVQVQCSASGGIAIQAKICANALALSYPPGAQVNRSSRRS